MMALFLPAYYNNKGMVSTRSYYKVWEINYSGYIVISSSPLKANSCLASGEEDAFLVFRLIGPFTISMYNKFVVVGCNTSGSFAYDGFSVEARCVFRSDPLYCSYGYREITLPDAYMYINFTGGGLSNLSGDEKKCDFSTILEPSTFTVVDNKTNLFWGEGRKADYGLRLNWGVGHQNCSTAQGTTNYSCSANAECLESPSGRGHVCRIAFLDTKEMATSTAQLTQILTNAISRGGECHNLAGSYNCSCAKGYTRDGFTNGSRCQADSSDATLLRSQVTKT
ncbi:hypothetical protein SUGI_0459400 [Cryptomeria japonica]|nr:hypothetical protein SUGI_0459400 [Cryptomeria japonica]